MNIQKLNEELKKALHEKHEDYNEPKTQKNEASAQMNENDAKIENDLLEQAKALVYKPIVDRAIGAGWLNAKPANRFYSEPYFEYDKGKNIYFKDDVPLLISHLKERFARIDESSQKNESWFDIYPVLAEIGQDWELYKMKPEYTRNELKQATISKLKAKGKSFNNEDLEKALDRWYLPESLEKNLNEEDFEAGVDKLPEKLQALVDGKYDGEEPLAEIVMLDLEDLTVDELVQIMNTQHDSWNSLYPSGWDIELGEYPAKLAEALVKSNAKESLTDIYNVFYSHRALAEGAIDVLKEDTLNDFDTTMHIVEEIADAEVLDEMLNTIAERYPEFVEELKTKIKEEDPEIFEEA